LRVALDANRLSASGYRRAQQRLNSNLNRIGAPPLGPAQFRAQLAPDSVGLSLISADIGENVNSVDELAAFAAEAKKSGRGMQGTF
jgi:hypothetical protein